MVDRLLGALKGDVATFEEVEHDESATIQAAAIVAVSAILGGIGSALSNSITDGDSSFFAVFITGVSSVLISWAFLAAVLNFVGTKFFGAESTFGEMLRVTGFAAVVTWFVVVPFVGLIALLWYFYVLFKAIRAGLDIPTIPTIIVILIGLVIRLVLGFLFLVIF